MTKDEQIAELKQSLAQAKQKKTLRDEFAMAALSGVIYMYGTTFAAKEAYDIADEMMKERNK